MGFGVLCTEYYNIDLCSASDYYWIGLSDLAHTGQWTWQHSWSPPSWTHWADGEPDGGGQHCAMIWGGHTYHWADKDGTVMTCTLINPPNHLETIFQNVDKYKAFDKGCYGILSGFPSGHSLQYSPEKK